MKKIIGFLVVGLLVISCSKKEETVNTDNNTMLEEPKAENTAESTDDRADAEPLDITSATVIAEGRRLIEASDCLTCHKDSGKLIGPAYDEVAKKYGEKDANVLVQKIIEGGSGNWGEIAMQPHADLSKEDAKKMVAYILSQK